MDFFKLEPKKVKKGLCCVRLCRGKLQKKDRSHSGHFCRRCRDRRYRLSNPISYAFDKLKSNAKRRQIPFFLSIEEFRKFCKKTNYVKKKGKTAGSLSIDRIHAEFGYEYGNLQVLTLRENSRKAAVDRKIKEQDLQYAPGEHPFGEDCT